MMTTLSIEQETFKSFFQLSKEAISKIWNTKLSGNDWKVYSFLNLIDPFGDRWCELPDIENICQLLAISQASFYRAMSKLKEAELINAEDKGWRFKNILGFAKMRGHSQNCETILKNEKPLSKMRIDSQNCENQSPEPLPELDSNLSQTLQTNSDLSDQSERLKDDRKMEDLQDRQDIQEERITIQGNREWGTGNREQGTENGEPGTGNSEGVLRENTAPDCPAPVNSDQRLKNEEFIKYCRGKLPKARDIKRYLLTNDKTTGDRILERLWLEYEQWKTGKSNPNSTGNEYFDNLIEEYRKTKPWEEFNWDLVNWDKLPCFDLWLAKAKNCRVDYTFTEDNSLGYTRNLRILFYRWYEQYYVKQSETVIPENPQALGLINAFRQIMGGGHYA